MAKKKNKEIPLVDAYLTSEVLANQKPAPGEEIKPVATNSMPSEELFIERKEYKDLAYPYNDDEVPTPIDIWYNRGLYGKIDTDYNPVFVDEKYLKRLPSETGDTFALNFVVDAFTDLQNYMRIAANEGKIFTEDTKFLAMEPKRGWTSVQNRYYEHITVMYEGFAATFLDQGKNKRELTDFKDFMKLFQTYLKTVQPDFPFTRTGYITSKYCPITTTGIVIELELASHGDDQVKYDDYIGDVNFVFFTRAARLFGFWVDKNAPWRLVADLKSEVMQKYMSRYPEAPVEPPMSGSQPQLPLPCAPEWFGDLKNQKVEFKKPGQEEGAIGYIAELLDCSDPLRSRFKIQEVVDEIEIALVQSTDLILPQSSFVEGPQSSLNADKTQAQIINIAAPSATGTGQFNLGAPSSQGAYGPTTLDDFRWLTAPLPQTRNGQVLRETVYKYYDVGGFDSSFSRRTGLGAWKPQPIRISAAGSTINTFSDEIKSYTWTVLEDAVDGVETPFYLTPNSPDTISPTNLTGTDVYFIPVRRGINTIQLQLQDKRGNMRDEVSTLIVNVCTLPWADTANKFAMTPDAAEAFGPAWIYSKLKAEIAEVWREWNENSTQEYTNWLGATRNVHLIVSGTNLPTLTRTQVPRDLADETISTGFGPNQLFPFPFKKQKDGLHPGAGGYQSPELDPTIGQPFGRNANRLCTPVLRGGDQLPQTGELEFLRTRLGWDIVGKHKFLTSWIKYITSNADGSKFDRLPGFAARPGILERPPSWQELIIRAEIGPDIFRPGTGPNTGWQTLPSGQQPCLHQFVYNQWQARTPTLGAAAYGTQAGNNRYIFHPPPVFGSCETKIERYQVTPASRGYPVKNYPFRNGNDYQMYRVPRDGNLNSLNSYEKGLPDDQMGDLFGGALADLFEIILVLSSQLLGGVPIKQLTGNQIPPASVGTSWISGPPGYFVAYSREPFSGMGVVPFHWFQWQRNSSGTGRSDEGTAGVDDSTNLNTVASNYRSDFVIKKIDFNGAYTRILNGRQWNDGSEINGQFTPYERWRREVYRRAGETFPQQPTRYLFVDDPRFREAIIPWESASNGANTSSPSITPREMDEIVRYLISLDPTDTNRYGDMLLFVLSVASDEGCIPIEVPSTTTPYNEAESQPSLDTFETLPFDYGSTTAYPDEPPREKDWVLAFGDVEEYSNKREQYTQAIKDYPRLLREWELRKSAYDKWVVDYADWLTLPRLSFDNLYLHNPPVLRSPGEYIRSFETDIDLLQIYTLNFYNSYVAKHPFIVTSQFNKCGDGTFQKIETRELLSDVEFMRTYDDLFWLKFYFAIRISESDRILSFSEEDAMIKQIENLYSNSLASSDSNKFTKSLQLIAYETNGVFEDKSGLTVQNKDDKIINKFKNITEQKALTLRDVYDIVLPDGSFQP